MSSPNTYLPSHKGIRLRDGSARSSSASPYPQSTGSMTVPTWTSPSPPTSADLPKTSYSSSAIRFICVHWSNVKLREWGRGHCRNRIQAGMEM